MRSKTRKTDFFSVYGKIPADLVYRVCTPSGKGPCRTHSRHHVIEIVDDRLGLIEIVPCGKRYCGTNVNPINHQATEWPPCTAFFLWSDRFSSWLSINDVALLDRIKTKVHEAAGQSLPGWKRYKPKEIKR